TSTSAAHRVKHGTLGDAGERKSPARFFGQRGSIAIPDEERGHAPRRRHQPRSNRFNMKRNIRSFKSVALRVGVLALLVGGVAACNAAERSSSPDDSTAVQLTANASNARIVEALIAEIEPHLRFAGDGTWALDPDATLSPTAQAFVELARANMSEITSTRAMAPASSTANFSVLSSG